MPTPQPPDPIREMTAAAVKLAAAVPDQTDTVTQVLLHLNQLSALLAGRAKAGEAPRVLNALYRHLAKLAGAGPEAAVHVQPLLDQLNQLAAAGQLHTAKPRRSARGRGERNARYLVREGARGERLVETRPGSEKDFYVTKQDYDAAIRALARTADPHTRFEPLLNAFHTEGGTPTASAYPLRVVLRFLRQLDPPLLTGQRGRYSLAVKPTLFERRAREAWQHAISD